MSACALFDFADTLAELQPRRQDIVADYIARVGGIHIGPEAIARAYKAVDLLLPYSSVKTRTREQRDQFYQEYNRQMFALLGVTHCADPAGLIAAFAERKAHWQLKPGALDTLRALRQRGYRIGIISNFDSRLQQVVHDHLGLGEWVDYLHISQTEGVEKPDPRFYLGFFERHGLPIERSVYVGDSYTLDFLPATGIGLRAWLLDEAGLYSHLPEAIRSIGDVPGLLPGSVGESP
ncbi:MAG: HAD-IA family hydrolase [Gammaproteobacteria bacterium]|nr:HAD-IA family hydrolase [Gammaproteobacteria bacterium]